MVNGEGSFYNTKISLKNKYDLYPARFLWEMTQKRDVNDFAFH